MANSKLPPPKELPKPVKPRGKAIIRTDAEIDEMTSAEAMEALAVEAAEDWEEFAPPEYSRLLGEVE